MKLIVEKYYIKDDEGCDVYTYIDHQEALFWSVIYEDEKSCHFWLKNGADINVFFKDGFNILGHIITDRTSTRISTYKLLLKLGACLSNVGNGYSATALMQKTIIEDNSYFKHSEYPEEIVTKVYNHSTKVLEFLLMEESSSLAQE